jgi:nitric-oxide synthase
VGRAGWSTLALRDSRHLLDPQEIVDDLVEHLRYATNFGAIRPTMTALNPQVRVLNEQLIRYGDDPQYAGFCASLRRSGWPLTGERFEVLPLVMFGTGGVTVHPLPRDAVMEVPIGHPRLPWFADLGLRWHAVPALSNMLLRVDPCTAYPVVFNGWYVSDEISARNLAGPERYDVLPAVAAGLGLEVEADRDGYWRQRALIEVDAAVLWSFRQAGAKISSPDQEAHRFVSHLEREEGAGRAVPGDWSWMISPIAPVLLPTYHRYYSPPGPAVGPDVVADEAFGEFGRQGWHLPAGSR